MMAITMRSAVVLFILSCAHGFSSLQRASPRREGRATRYDTSGNGEDLWTTENMLQNFDSLNHPGYTTESDSSTFTGGWLAHRAYYEHDPRQPCWINEEKVIEKISKYDYSKMSIGRPPRLLVLYGSLRESSFSRKIAFEFARLFDHALGCDVRVYNPRGLPVRDPALEDHVKVLELRALTEWSDGHVWGLS